MPGLLACDQEAGKEKQGLRKTELFAILQGQGGDNTRQTREGNQPGLMRNRTGV